MLKVTNQNLKNQQSSNNKEEIPVEVIELTEAEEAFDINKNGELNEEERRKLNEFLANIENPFKINRIHLKSIEYIKNRQNTLKIKRIHLKSI